MSRKRPRRRKLPGSRARPPTDGLEVSRRRREGEGFLFVRAPVEASLAHEKLVEQEKWVKSLPSHIAELNRLFAQHDAFDILAGIQLLEAMNADRPL